MVGPKKTGYLIFWLFGLKNHPNDPFWTLLGVVLRVMGPEGQLQGRFSGILGWFWPRAGQTGQGPPKVGQKKKVKIDILGLGSKMTQFEVVLGGQNRAFFPLKAQYGPLFAEMTQNRVPKWVENGVILGVGPGIDPRRTLTICGHHLALCTHQPGFGQIDPPSSLRWVDLAKSGLVGA